MTMKVLAVASQKGGVGKTTLAAHLAVAAEAAGIAPALLIDLDPQQSLTDWWQARGSSAPALVAAGRDLGGTLTALRGHGAQLVVIDTPPAASPALASTLALADLVLLPVRPSPHDLRAVGRTVELAPAGRVLFVISAARVGGRLVAEARPVLAGVAPVAGQVIADRQIFASSMTDGGTAVEAEPRGLAAKEIGALWAELARILKIKRGKK